MRKNEITGFERTKFLAKFIFVLVFVYVCLFELILPVNKILPKPSLLLESFIPLIKDYNLLTELALTFSIVFAGMLTGYFLIYLSKNLICKIYYNYPSVTAALGMFKYIPVILSAVFFELWFAGTFWAELLFSVLAVYSLLFHAFISEIANVHESYILFAKSLGMPDKKIYSQVIWHHVHPRIWESIQNINCRIWLYILVFELIAAVGGIGKLLGQIIAYKDLAALLAVSIIISVIIYVTNHIIKYFSGRFIRWNSK